ncbi:MerR family transcriptional regulator [Microbispora sp. GKU 823]|uniref:MerR family transcriptional regulator n=1 Tax=Microbispora sp. GKU 823 TaxID=1652100 RepID=UPI0009D27120|nr:MerR family transcriptional regulator [Microbispora sp. GKU 823]OPG12260.1 MerR family transcriptional regulator [Microbispora sp. GKU 823]
MRIGELARETGVNRRLLRYYEEQGLLTPSRLANGYREYAETDVVAVRHIRMLLAAGLPTAVIARLLHCIHDEGDVATPSGCPTLVDSLRRERARITKTIDELRNSQQALDAMLHMALQQAANAAQGEARRRSPHYSPGGGQASPQTTSRASR